MGKELSLEYNTERSKLILSEYGRSIQKMVDYATKIEDVEKRQKVANEILTLMGQLNLAFARILRVSILISLRLIYVINGGTPNKLTLARCERVPK